MLGIVHGMLIENVIDPVQVAVLPDTPIPEVLKRLLDVQHDSGAVVDESNRFLGVIGVRDTLRKIVPSHLYDNPNLSNVVHEGYFEERFEGLSRFVAKDLMDPDVVTVRPDDTAIRAIALIVENKRKTIPVLDANRYLLGMVTRQSLIRTVMKAHASQRKET
ncbi:MAG: CBS domain-containing protein [Myxococcota bacterium]